MISRRERLREMKSYSSITNAAGKKMNSYAHVGLWLDRYYPQQEEQGADDDGARGLRGHFLREVTLINESSSYKPFFEAHGQALQQLSAGEGEKTLCQKVKVQGRLVIGMGTANVIENGVSLHRTYGVPYLPGSGLKGLAARYARQRLLDPNTAGSETPLLDERWRKGNEDAGQAAGEFYETVFGGGEERGFVTFHDALPFPRQKNLLVSDIMTPHHRDYYGGANKPPADWDMPVPVPFLSVQGEFQLCVSGPTEWAQIARDILVAALRDEGAGAKTSSGYGRMVVVEEAKPDVA